ncbi:MAG: glycosyltransferase family 10 domain-containing protein [Alphaproteobacteria bacterium]
MQKIKIKFCDFWDGFDCKEDEIYKNLSKNYKLEIVGDNPDVVIYSSFGNEFLNYLNAKLIFYATEHYFPNSLYADYLITSKPANDSKSFRMANFPFYPFVQEFINQNNSSEYKKFPKTEFCNFIYNNKNAKNRNNFFKLLSNYKKVDSFGKLFNNKTINDFNDIPQNLHWKEEKIHILKRYKFTICFENGLRPYSFSEKVIQALQAGSIPIYWGDNSIYDYVNPDAIIDARKFNNMNKVVEYIEYLENNKTAMEKIKNANPFFKDSEIYEQTEKKIEQFLINCIEDKIIKQEKKYIKIIFLKVFNKVLGFIYKKYWKTISFKRRFFGGW